MCSRRSGLLAQDCERSRFGNMLYEATLSPHVGDNGIEGTRKAPDYQGRIHTIGNGPHISVAQAIDTIPMRMLVL